MRSSGVAIAICMGVGLSFASSPADALTSQTHDDLSQDASIVRKGALEWGFYAGAGRFTTKESPEGGRAFVAVGVRLGRVFSGPHGPGFLNGNFQISLDVAPLFLVLRDEAVYGFQASLTVRHYLVPRARVRPFVSLGSGPLVTTEELPSDTSSFNFVSHAGVGLVLPVAERATFTLEAGLQHVSNAETAERNPGLNASYFTLGVSWYHGSSVEAHLGLE